MKTLLFVIAVCTLVTSQAQAQEDPYASTPTPGPGPSQPAPAQEDPYASTPTPGPGPSQPAFADESPPIRAALFGMGLISFRFSEVGFGIGARYQHAIVPAGFLKSVPSIRDELLLEGGIEFHTATQTYPALNRSLDRTWSDLEFSVAAVWELWFTESFAAYPRVGFGFGAGLGDWAGNYFLGIGGAGVIYKLGALALRAEISNLALGIGAGLVF